MIMPGNLVNINISLSERKKMAMAGVACLMLDMSYIKVMAVITCLNIRHVI